MDTVTIIRLVILFVLIVLSSFFSSSETALSVANRIKIRAIEEEGNKRAQILGKIFAQNNKMLSAILICNNVVNLSASALCATFAMSISVPVGIATGILTFVILLFGEIVPKTRALSEPEKLALRWARVIYGLMLLLTPVIAVVDAFSGAVLRLLGVNKDVKVAITENELKTYVDASHEDGVIET
ncbi:MAG: DUF21 domain-containing protein, partial [Lachnospiraceae bacterium]|nr:DUF21 domain-containing protein [Lachnospiraceae bacterium]